MSLWQELKERNVVRVTALYLAAAWLILQVADLVFEAYEFPAFGMRVLITLMALGLPAAIALAWIYEWTPDGIRRDVTPAGQRFRRSGGRRLTAAIIVIAMLGLAVFLFVRPDVLPDDGEAWDAPEEAIAVMPFVNVADSAESDYFSDGLSAELMNLLADIPELRVTARSSSFYFKGRDAQPADIGRQLNVSHILEGEVRQSGDQLRISVQLINTKTGFRVWQDRYDRTMSDIFALQDEIAARTVDNLRVTMLGEAPRARVTDPAAFNAFLTASYFYGQRSPEAYENTLEHVEQSIAIDPEFPPAWTLLASTYVNLAILGEIPFEEGRRQARDAVERALQIDPDFSYANSARAWHAMFFERDFVTAAAFFRRALALAPGDATVLSNAAVFASTTGQFDKALDLTHGSIARNPISPVVHLNLSGLLNRMGRYADAIEAAHRALELNPGMESAMVNRCESLLLSERADRALECAQQITNELHRLKLSALAHRSLGAIEESDRALAELTAQFGNDEAFEIAKVHAWRDEFDAAFAMLDLAIAEEQNILGIRTEPVLRALHDDPRWNDLMSELGLADEQLASARL